MSIERARLLIRVANQIPHNEDKKELLNWADELLAGNKENNAINNLHQITFPISIFRKYKGILYRAKLLKGWRVQLELDGKVSNSPSTAAGKISGNFENGWRVWRYIDESSNKEYPIDKLRNN